MSGSSIYSSFCSKYKILSKEEEQKMIAEERHDEAHLRDLLVFHNMRAAIAVGQKYATSRMDSQDDAIQRAMVGLYNASRKYDLDSGIRFLSYATWSIIQQCKYITNENLCDSKINKMCVSLDEPLSTKMGSRDGDEITRLDLIQHFKHPDYDMEASGSDAVEACSDGDLLEIIFEIANSITRFSQRDIEIFKRYHLDLLTRDGDDSMVTYANLGKEFGMTRERVRQIIRDVRAVVRKKLIYNYSQEVEVTALIADYEKHKTEAQWQTPTYREVMKTDEKLKKEEEYIEAVKKEKPTRMALLEKLRASIYAKEFERHGVSPDVAVPEKVQKKTDGRLPEDVRTNVVVRTSTAATIWRLGRKRKEKTFTFFIPESLDIRLNGVYAIERLKDKMRHPWVYEANTKNSRMCSLARRARLAKHEDFHSTIPEDDKADSQNEPKVVIAGEREDEPTEQEIFTAEMETKIVQIDEEQISQGNHFDDMYELQDEN